MRPIDPQIELVEIEDPKRMRPTAHLDKLDDRLDKLDDRLRKLDVRLDKLDDRQAVRWWHYRP